MKSLVLAELPKVMCNCPLSSFATPNSVPFLAAHVVIGSPIGVMSSRQLPGGFKYQKQVAAILQYVPLC